MTGPDSNPLEVVCVCGGYGFPHGISSSRRVLLLGRSFLSRGIPFRLLHCGTDPTCVNKAPRGTYSGIQYEYTTGVVKRPANPVLRGLVYLWGYLVLAARLYRLRKNPRTVVYLFLLRNLAQIYVGLLCRCLNIPVIQDVCEWWPGTPQADPLSDWIYESFLPRYSAGAVAISAPIEERLQTIASGSGISYPVLRVPLLIDASEPKEQDPAAAGAVPYIFWLGSVDSYMEDVLFSIEALGRVNREGVRCDAVLAGPVTAEGLRRVECAAANAGLPEGAVRATGFIEDRQLRTLCRNAAVLLMPLWEDDRSRTRYPHKLTEYLLSGRPVVTSPVGEAAALLEDSVTACFHPAGDARLCAAKILFLLRDPAAADAIGEAGRRIAHEKLDYRVHAGALEQLARQVAQCA